MPFQLTIAEGKEAGREFVFEQPQVVIGRTSECDVVLYDPGVSRKHARIFSEGDAYFVEDMGSSNGTKVNGTVIKKQKLSSGDAVSLGPVVFSFNSAVRDGTDPAHGVPNVEDQGTHVFTLEEGKQRALKQAAALAPDGANTDQLRAIQRTDTRSMAAIKPRMSTPGIPKLSNPAIPVIRSSNPGVPAARASGPHPAGGRLSMADRARIRRESPGMSGALKIFWAEASTPIRAAVFAVLGLMVLGAVGALYAYVWNDNSGKKVVGPEPTLLTKRPIDASFGLGEGVTYERADQKVFDFEFVTATKAVVMLHYQCADISEGEVVVTVNGVDVGMLPPDTLNSLDISHDLLVPPDTLKKGQRNVVIFDNVKNPPGTETWRIWNVWVEVVPLPEMAMDDLLRSAKNAYDHGDLLMQQKDVGARNRYEAWKEYRNAWLMLEAYQGTPKPELYTIARAKVREAQQVLDGQCQRLMLEAMTAYQQKDWPAARATLDHVKDYFPGTDQPCSFRADQKRAELGL